MTNATDVMPGYREYALRGNDTTIIYSEEGAARPGDNGGGPPVFGPQLDYEHQDQKLSFSFEEIAGEASSIGSMLTVTLGDIPDLETRRLTLIMPAINMDNIVGQQTSLNTLAILTTQRTSIGGPGLVKGALQVYQTLALQGTVRVVPFRQ